jgi:hypothetical protein
VCPWLLSLGWYVETTTSMVAPISSYCLWPINLNAFQPSSLARECHTSVPKEANRSFHMCAQDIQITRMANNKVNSSQCYDYSIIRVYLLQNDP